jgi:hypothetical protein
LNYNKDLTRQSYLVFLNSEKFKNYQSFVGLGLRELVNDEFTQYCLNKIKPIKPPYFIQQQNSNRYLLTSDFYFLAYSSGCYYIDQSTGKWSSYGLEVESDTTLSYTHCKSNHLTAFASGFEIISVTLDFSYFFANSSFEQNKTIYLTVLILFAVYILFSIWGRWMDKQDFLKVGVTPLIDNHPIDDYFYEIIIITGNRVNAGTDSKVILH